MLQKICDDLATILFCMFRGGCCMKHEVMLWWEFSYSSYFSRLLQPNIKNKTTTQYIVLPLKSNLILEVI